ncbi:MAG: NnrS family protein [Alphaproteobacteria bacterium]
MTAIPRYRSHTGPVILSAGFRPFFLAAAIWAAIAIPLWLAVYSGGTTVPSLLQPFVWHGHEMVFGFGAAVVAGFLLTAIPNWTGRLPLQGAPLLILVLLWAIGRIAVLLSAHIGAPLAAIADLAFPALFLAVVAREIIAGRNWRNLPMLVALALLLGANLLVHLEALGVADTAALGNRLGIATLLMLIALVGGRIVPSFTRNWLTKQRPGVRPPAPESALDRAALIVTALGLALWAFAPDTDFSGWALIAAGVAAGLRLARWRGLHTAADPLLLILHVGYAWLALGLLLLGAERVFLMLPFGAALHVLTVGAIGTMTLAVMTRASLGHTGRPLITGPATLAIYGLITIAAVLRLAAPFDPEIMAPLLSASGAAWSGAFALFAVFYGGALTQPRLHGEAARPI